MRRRNRKAVSMEKAGFSGATAALRSGERLRKSVLLNAWNGVDGWLCKPWAADRTSCRGEVAACREALVLQKEG